ncbi:MAG: hypothetical protein KJ646_02060 [Nanoarchaeota archaeon]|nr:hypothetical protein [Nanoarchaeota archaeon]MBU4116869.1 hypothetical protein [Nanoarchaeota archaeon]
MVNLYKKLNPKINNLLEEHAKSIAKEFSENYRTFRNPLGKEYILVYGGNPFHREVFIDKINKNLPLEVNAFVLDSNEKIGAYDMGNNPRAVYINFDTVLI